MRNNLNILLIVLAASVNTVALKAQDTVPEIFDLVVVQKIVHKLKMFDTLPSPVDDTLKVIFRISQPAQAKTLYVKLGTAQDIGDLRNGVYNTIDHNGHYCFFMNGIEHKIWGQAAYFIYSFTLQEIQALKWVTVYAESQGGTLSNKKYYKYK